MTTTPRFEVGDHVRFGQGKIVHEVVAVTAGTRYYPSYDLITRTGARRGRRYQGVIESALNPATR